MDTSGTFKRTVSFSSEESLGRRPQITITPEPLSRPQFGSSRIQVARSQAFPSPEQASNRIQITHSASPPTLTPQTYSSIEEEAALQRVVYNHKESERSRQTPQPKIERVGFDKQPSITIRQSSVHTHESLPTRVSVRRNSQTSQTFVGEPFVTKTSDVTRIYQSPQPMETQNAPLTTIAAGSAENQDMPLRINQLSVQVTDVDRRVRYSPLAGYPVQGGHPKLQRPPYLEHTPYNGTPMPRQLTLDKARDVIGMDFTDAYTINCRAATDASIQIHREDFDPATRPLKGLSRKSTEAFSQGAQTLTRAIEELSQGFQRSLGDSLSTAGPSSYKNRYPSTRQKSNTTHSPVSPVIVFEDPRRNEGCCRRAQKVLIYTDDGDVESHYAF